MARYADVNDAARFSRDPTFRLIGSWRIWERGAALTFRLQSFETELLTHADSLACLAAKLRPGNVHSAEGWEELLVPEIERQQRLDKEAVFRADAAFANPELYEALEERTVKYGIRLPANDKLQRRITELLTRPVGRPGYKPVVRSKSFLYQAARVLRVYRCSTST